MNLKMGRASGRLGHVLADRGSDAEILVNRKPGFRRTNPALHLHLDALLVDRSNNPVEVVERLAVFQRTIVAQRRFEGNLGADTDMLVEHQVSAKPHKDTLQAGVSETSRGCGAGDALAECRFIDAASVRPGAGRSETQIQIEGGLRGGKR